MKLANTLRAVLLLAAFCCLGLQANAQASKLAAQLKKLEAVTKWDFQNETWRDKRDAWVSEVGTCCTSVSQLANLMTRFETSLKWEASQDSWRDRRDGWVSEVNNAGSYLRLGELLLEVETQMKWDACNDSWRDERDTWVSTVRTAMNSANTSTSSRTSGKPPVGGTTTSTQRPTNTNLQKAAQFVSKLEVNTLYSAQTEGWSNDRTAWKERIESCNDVATLREVLKTYEVNLKWDATQETWRERRDGWVSELGSASNLAAVCKLLLELEQYMKWEACNESWRQEREQWVRDVEAMVN